MKKSVVQLISKTAYGAESGIILFEDECSFSFGKIELENTSLKFGWNSKGINPEIKIIEEISLIFIGVDTYVVGYNYGIKAIAFFLNTSANFKWFESIDNGIGIVSETEIILLNTTTRCTLRNCFFFGDTIMGTKIDKNKIQVNFLVNDDALIII